MSGLRERLLLLVERAGSARELSRRAGLTEIHVGQILRRLARQPTASVEMKTLAAIARGGRVSESWLLAGRGSPDDVHDAQLEPDDIEAELRRSARVMLGDLPDWLEILAIAQQRAKDLNREIPPWVWEAIAASSATLTGKLTGPALYDLAVVFHQHGLGKPSGPPATTLAKQE